MSEFDLVGQVRSKHRRTAWAAAAFVVVLAALALLSSFLTAFSLHAKPQRPSDVRWTFTEGVGTVVWGRALLMSELGTVRAQAQGHAPIEAELRRAGARRIELELQPLPGKVDVAVDVAGEFALAVNGTVIEGPFPVRLALPRGAHEVVMSGPFLKPLLTSWDVVGFGETQRFDLRPEPAGSFLWASASPPGARLFLDGEPWVAAGRSAPVALGSHELRARLDGYFEQTESFEARPDAEAVFDWALRPRPASLALRTVPAGAAVLLNGKYAGVSPLTLALSPLRTHRIKARLGAHQDADFSLLPGPGERLERELRLDGRRIVLLASADAPAEIRVNGAPAGEVPLELVLGVGDVVEATAAGLLAPPLRVDAVGGDERRWTFRMLPPAAHAHRMGPEREQPVPGLALRKMPLGLRPEITRPFMLGEAEVTRAAFAAHSGEDAPPEGLAAHPEAGVSWSDAARFCNWLSAKNGLDEAYFFDAKGVLVAFNSESKGYRLPTELEWEAGAGQLLPPGVVAAPFANLSGRENAAQRHLSDYVDGHAGTSPVESHPANRLGLYGLSGNVAEWVHDHYADRPDPMPSDHYGPETGVDHVVKGGSHRTHDWGDLDAKRRGFVAGKRADVGFRVARWLH